MLRSTVHAVVLACLVAFALGCSGAAEVFTSVVRDGSASDADVDADVDAHVDASGGPQGCGLAGAAFCETFEVPSPGGRGGDLDEARWAFARYGHIIGRGFERWAAFSRIPDPDGEWDRQANVPTFCGAEFSGLLPGQDVRICAGPGVSGEISNRLEEVFDDGSDDGMSSMMIRQPFDFAAGGRVVFDVDAKRNVGWTGHGWWPALFITEDPAPAPYITMTTIGTEPRRGLGVIFLPTGGVTADPRSCSFAAGGCNQVGLVVVFDDHVVREVEVNSGYFLVEDGVPNHFEIEVSPDTLRVHASDAGTSELRLIAEVSDLALGFSRGYVHLQHVQFNAYDARASPAQTYRWDNVGFDGPVLPALRSYDVAETSTRSPFSAEYREARRFGYPVDGSALLTVSGVDLSDAVRATLNLDVQAEPGSTLVVTVNGNEHALTLPSSYTSANTHTRALSVEIPIAELRVGENVFGLALIGSEDYQAAGNIDLSLEIAR